jgi:amidohydrolase
MTVIDSIKEDVFEDRKALHLIPEPGFEEVKTSSYIKAVLNKLDIDHESIGGTGIVAYIEGTSPSRTIAFRTDMDGLSVTEESSYEYHSQHDNFMHACGHDGHMAMMLGLARLLKQPNVTLIDNVVLIFQPAEEGPGGAEVIVKAGILNKYKVDEIYGIHVFPEIAQGRIGLKSGPMMAMTGEFDIEVIAKSAHGAMPHIGIDGIVIASEIVLGLQTIVSRNISPISPAVMTIGRMESGERRNIIAGRAKLEGTIRAFDKAVYNCVKDRMKQYVAGIAHSYNVTINLSFVDMYPPVINDEKLFNAFVSHHEGLCDIIEPQMISEDFSYYQEAIPGLFYFIGTYNEEKAFVYPLHNSKFNFDDQILLNGMETYKNILVYRGSIAL